MGIDRVFIHPMAGVLSALGMGLARVTAMKEQSVEKPLTPQSLLPPTKKKEKGKGKGKGEGEGEGEEEEGEGEGEGEGKTGRVRLAKRRERREREG